MSYRNKSYFDPSNTIIVNFADIALITCPNTVNA